MTPETQETRANVRLTLEFPADMPRDKQVHALQMALYKVAQVVNVEIVGYKEEAELYGNK